MGGQIQKTGSDLIYTAIDTDNIERACRLVQTLAPYTGIKLGLEFFNNFGPHGIEKVLNAAPDTKLFIDLKYHDIPNTVAGAVRGICSHFAPAYLNVHASGGVDMMRAAMNACAEASQGKTKLIAVTILTSLSDDDLALIGYREGGSAARVLMLARLAQDCGLDGVVCSSHEIAPLRAACGHHFSLMVPGIRPVGADLGDQKRVMTPPEAIQRGATHIVIGRPITGANDPAKAAQDIMASLAA
jgi:orotidine-5'-phosphate decarboxylase